jgi:hypothetical protein
MRRQVSGGRTLNAYCLTRALARQLGRHDHGNHEPRPPVADEGPEREFQKIRTTMLIAKISSRIWSQWFVGVLGDQGPKLERKLTHKPCAQLPIAMTAPKTVKVMRPINSA